LQQRTRRKRGQTTLKYEQMWPHITVFSRARAQQNLHTRHAQHVHKLVRIAHSPKLGTIARGSVHKAGATAQLCSCMVRSQYMHDAVPRERLEARFVGRRNLPDDTLDVNSGQSCDCLWRKP